jgi:hypothetical protein
MMEKPIPIWNGENLDYQPRNSTNVDYIIMSLEKLKLKLSMS